MIRRSVPRREQGQVTVLVIGLLSIALVLILGAIDVTAVHLARVRLVDLADAAALDAADSLDEGGAYTGGVGDAVTVSSQTVRSSASSYLAARAKPEGIASWAIAPGTGADGRDTAVVVVTARVELPMTGGLLSALGQDVTITVQSRARAPLQG
ncbi:MAG TPA: pilus assembly protein TadG-related protein [Dermatophilaceae bacterium]|nr:pilus assembly protein TadG-related protein [Dermatophilaceae bacterium]